MEEIVEGPQQLLRVLPLPSRVRTAAQHRESGARRNVRRRANQAPTNARIHASRKDRVLQAWRDLKDDAKQRIAEVERKQKAIRQKLDRFGRCVPLRTVDRHRHLRPTLRQAWRGAHARADGPTTSPSSKKWTWRAFSPSQSVFYRTRRTCGCSRH